MKGTGLVVGGMIGGCVGLVMSAVWFLAGSLVTYCLMEKHGEKKKSERPYDIKELSK